MTGGDPGPFAWWRLVVVLGAMAAVGGGTVFLMRLLVDGK